MSGLTARLASASDHPLVTTIVTLAFTNDPLWGWVLARPDGQTDHLAPFWGLFLEGAFRYPNTWVAGQGEATAVWIPPGGTEMTAAQEKTLGRFVIDHLGPKADAFFVLLERFESAHPRDVDHYYLSLLGTHPEHRGHGIGMSLLAHTLEVIDAEHVPSYLESSNPANNERYASVGFEPIGEFAHPGSGPACHHDVATRHAKRRVGQILRPRPLRFSSRSGNRASRSTGAARSAPWALCRSRASASSRSLPPPVSRQNPCI